MLVPEAVLRRTRAGSYSSSELGPGIDFFQLRVKLASDGLN